MSGIAHKKKFSTGLIMHLAFWVSFAVMMSPVFGDGRNVLNLTDDLFNSVSMSSVTKYLPEAQEEAETLVGEEATFVTKGKDEGQTQRIKTLFEENGATVTGDKELQVSGDIGVLLVAAAEDAQVVFDGKGAEVADKYGYDKLTLKADQTGEQHVMNDWWAGLDAAAKDFTRNEHFEEAKLTHEVLEKSVEPAYNYNGITPQSASSEAPFIVLSLAGYILYTVWYGFSLLFMFEGWGLKLEH